MGKKKAKSKKTTKKATTAKKPAAKKALKAIQVTFVKTAAEPKTVTLAAGSTLEDLLKAQDYTEEQINEAVESALVDGESADRGTKLAQGQIVIVAGAKARGGC